MDHSTSICDSKKTSVIPLPVPLFGFVVKQAISVACVGSGQPPKNSSYPVDPMRSCSRPPKSCSAGRSVMITENICNGPGVSDDDFLSRAHVEPGAIIINNCFNGGDGQSYPDTSQASGNTFCGNVGVGNRSGHQTLFSTFGSETVLYQYSGIHPSSQIPAWYYQQCVPPPAGFAAPFATFKTDGIGENPRDSKTKRARPKDTLKGLGFLREMAARLTNIILKALTPRGRQGAKK